MKPERIIHEANQIALFMETMPKGERVEGVAGHINDYWEPRIRRKFFALVEEGVEGFRPLVLEAVPRIRRPAPDA